MHNVVKWPNILQKSCGVNTARFLKYVRPFYNIMHERVNGLYYHRREIMKFKAAIKIFKPGYTEEFRRF